MVQLSLQHKPSREKRFGEKRHEVGRPVDVQPFRTTRDGQILEGPGSSWVDQVQGEGESVTVGWDGTSDVGVVLENPNGPLAGCGGWTLVSLTTSGRMNDDVVTKSDGRKMGRRGMATLLNPPVPRQSVDMPLIASNAAARPPDLSA